MEGIHYHVVWNETSWFFTDWEQVMLFINDKNPDVINDTQFFKISAFQFDSL